MFSWELVQSNFELVQTILIILQYILFAYIIKYKKLHVERLVKGVHRYHACTNDNMLR